MQQVSFYGFLKMKERNAIRDNLIKKYRICLNLVKRNGN